MAKREAEEQITKDGVHLGDIDSSQSANSLASAEIMSKRKILMPRGKHFTFSKKNHEETPSPPTHQTLSAEKAAKLTALARRFALAISKAKTCSGAPDYRPLARKYLDYYNEIESKLNVHNVNSAGKPEPASEKQLVSQNVQRNTSSDSSSDGETDEEPAPKIKIQGPTFKFLAGESRSDSPFKFETTGSNAKINLNGSEAPKLSGPVFQFSKPIRDPVFQFSSVTPKSSHQISEASGDRKNSTQPADVGTSTLKLNTTNSPALADRSLTSSSKSPFSFASSLTNTASTHLHNEKGGENQMLPSKSAQIASGSQDENSDEEYLLTIAMRKTNVGEEQETLLYEKRAKLMKYNPENTSEPYTTFGVGDLRVLKSAEKGTCRVVLRADGGLRILLNAAISGNFTYESMGNGLLVRIPALNGDHQIETYIVKVKSADDGAELTAILNESKN